MALPQVCRTQVKSHFQRIQSLFNVTASIAEDRGSRSVVRIEALELARQCDYPGSSRHIF
jgi:hypothetical protein